MFQKRRHQTTVLTSFHQNELSQPHFAMCRSVDVVSRVVVQSCRFVGGLEQLLCCLLVRRQFHDVSANFSNSGALSDAADAECAQDLFVPCKFAHRLCFFGTETFFRAKQPPDLGRATRWVVCKQTTKGQGCFLSPADLVKFSWSHMGYSQKSRMIQQRKTTGCSDHSPSEKELCWQQHCFLSWTKNNRWRLLGLASNFFGFLSPRLLFSSSPTSNSGSFVWNTGWSKIIQAEQWLKTRL